MKTKQKKTLAFLLCAALVLALCPAALAEGEEAPQTTGPWVIGETPYATFAEAVADVPKDGTPTTIQLTEDTTCSGWVVEASQNITVNLGGHTFNVSGPTVGSTGTETNNFQFLQGSTVTFQDGTLCADPESGAIIFIQNYCDLTLHNVEVDASGCATVGYVVSNNNGTTKITGKTSILAPEGQIAFDCYYKLGNNYQSVTVIVDTVGEIRGNIEYDYNEKNVTADQMADVTNNAKIVINSGTFTGSVNLPKPLQTEQVNITVNGGTFNDNNQASFMPYVSEGKTLIANGNGTYSLVDEAAVATVGGKGYDSLQEAINAANGNTVRLLKELTIGEQLIVNGNVTLDLGGKKLTSTFEPYAISVGENAALTIKNGTLENTVAGGVTITKNSSVTVENTATIVANGSVLRSSPEGGSKFYVYGNLECKKDNSAAILSNGAKNVVYVDGANIKSQHFGVYQNGSYGGATITVKNSEVTDTKGYGVYVSNSAANAGTADQGMQTLVIENSVITGPTAAEVKYTNVTIKGENTKLIATGTPVSEILNNNGGVTTGYALAVTHNGTADSKDSAAGTVIITDGQFTGLIGIQEPSDGTTTTASIAISGGTFTSPVPDEFCAPGYHPEELENGGYGVSDYYHTGTTGSGLVSGGVVIGTGTNTGAVTDPSLLPPQTGDAGSVGIVGALLLLASCGMAGIALRRSAKKREMN